MTNSHILDGSILTESAEPDMRQRLEDLKEITPNTTTLTGYNFYFFIRNYLFIIIIIIFFEK